MSTSDSSTELRKLIGCRDDLEDRTINFEPIPYTFRIPNSSSKECSIQSPPHWLLLDHSIAVIWSLFSAFTPYKALDIDDLKWAHEFLKEIRNAKGENPPDVKTCLTEIQNRLIALYAQLTHPKRVSDKGNVQENIPQENIPLERQKTTPIEASKVPKKESKTLKADDKESLKDMAKSDTNAARRQTVKKPPRDTRKTYVAQHKRWNALPTKPSPTASTKKSEASPKRDNTKKDEADPPVENFFTEVFQRNKNMDRVLETSSLTRKKTSTILQSDASDTTNVRDSIHALEEGKISLQFKKWITDEEHNNEEQAYRNLKNEIRNLTKNPKTSKDEVLKFLSNWREEQKERLHSELRRLNSIEEFMKSLKMDGFVPYVNEDLVQELASITNRKKSNMLS